MLIHLYHFKSMSDSGIICTTPIDHLVMSSLNHDPFNFVY